MKLKLIILFILSLVCEISNDFFSKKLMYAISEFDLIFLRHLIGAIIMLCLVRKFDILILLRIFIIQILIFSFIYQQYITFIIFTILFIFYCLKNNLILRSLFTFLAFFLTSKAMKTMSLDCITMSYYSIPLFSSLINYFISDEKIGKKYWIEFLLISYLLFNRTTSINLNMFLGCLSFSFCDILMRYSSENILKEMFYINLAIVFYSYFFISKDIFIIGFTNYKLYLFMLCLGSLFLHYCIISIFRDTHLAKLLSFRFINIIFSSLIVGNFFSKINLLIPVFIIIKLFF